MNRVRKTIRYLGAAGCGRPRDRNVTKPFAYTERDDLRVSLAGRRVPRSTSSDLRSGVPTMTNRSPRPKDQQTHAPSSAPGSWPIDVDPLIDPEIEVAIAGLDRPATLLGGMARYPLGQLESDLSPVPDAGRRAINGKRLRPVIALLCCAAQGGAPGRAAPVAAAIELLHNFTLVHDDIQDESDTRRHRPTVWSLWGRSQAINAGDALFAAAHLALYRSRIVGVADDLALRLSEAFAQTAIEIVQGQVLDLDHVMVHGRERVECPFPCTYHGDGLPPKGIFPPDYGWQEFEN